MRRVLVVSVLALLASGCGSQAPGAPAPPAVADASRVDMCTILTDPELSQLGIKLSSRKLENEVGVVGCRWVGQPIAMSLTRDKDNLASYQARPNDPAFTSFAVNMVNGRAGVQLGVRRDHSQCDQIMDGGPVSISVSVAQAALYDGPPINPCAEALRIAQMIEPRLPKARS